MASGGPTIGSGGYGSTGTVALTAGTIQAIARAVQPHLIVDGRELGDVASKSYENDTAVGRF